MDNNRSQTLDEALRTINEAMLAEGTSLKELIKSDYANLRTAVEDLAPRVARQFKASPQIDFAVASGKTIASGFDQQLRKNPYMVLGGVALGAIALGYLFGKGKPAPTSDYTGLSYGDAPLTEQTPDNVEL